MKNLRSIIQDHPLCLIRKETLKGYLMDYKWPPRTVQILVNLSDSGIVKKIQQNAGRLSQVDITRILVEQEDLHGTARKFTRQGIQLWADALGTVIEPPTPPKPVHPPAPKPGIRQTPLKKHVTQKNFPSRKILLTILFVLCAVSLIHFMAKDPPDTSPVRNSWIEAEALIQWKLKDGTLTFSGKGPLEDYVLAQSPPWDENEEMRDSIHTVKVEEGITHIGRYVFQNFTNLTDVILADSVTEIGDSAFDSCRKLTNLTLPAGLVKIGDYAFYNCENLTNADIPYGITSIGMQAFDGTGLRSVSLNSRCDFTFLSFPTDIDMVGDFETSGICGENVRWTLDELGKLTIEGNGALLPNDDFPSKSAPWYPHRQKITAVSIKGGITGIGNGAFYGCTNLERVSIPYGVAGIGHSAFARCRSLKNLALPYGLSSLGSSAFQDCTALTNIQIPGSLSAIAPATFMGCESLQNISLPGSIRQIGSSAFRGCKSLTSVVLPWGIQKIETYTFSDCESLRNIFVPSSVVMIKSQAFSGQNSLTSLKVARNCLVEPRAVPQWVTVAYSG